MSENDKQAEPVAWRINFGNGFHSAWVDGKPSEKVLNHWLKQGRKLDFAYTRPAQPVAADHTGLIKRIDAAIERVTQGRGLMSIPADPRSDVDLVLSECKALLQGENPPFWATDFHPAQPVQPAGAQGELVPEIDFDLKHTAYDRLCEAVKKSKWIPAEYSVNEWLWDCCDFLVNGYTEAPVVAVNSHVNETPKNEHDSDDVLKRAPLVRLTYEEIENEYCKAYAYLMMTDHYEFGLVANAIMDAMEKINQGETK